MSVQTILLSRPAEVLSTVPAQWSIRTVIYLKVDCNTLSRRLGDLRKRGVVLKPGQTLATLYEERTPLYEAYAHLTVDVSDTDVPGAVERIQKLLLLH